MKITKTKEYQQLASYIKKHKYKIQFCETHLYAFGWIDQASKTIVICKRALNGQYRSQKDILFLLAHEKRHLQHIVEKKFSVYYSVKSHTADGNSLKDRFDTAYKAELDCDTCARKYVRKYHKGHKSALVDRVYPKWRVASPFLPTRLFNKQHDIILRSMMKKLERKFNAARKLRN